MLMLDVRNSLANILDRYTLADTVEVTLRKMRRDRVPLPFLGVSMFPSPWPPTPPRRPPKSPRAKPRLHPEPRETSQTI